MSAQRGLDLLSGRGACSRSIRAIHVSIQATGMEGEVWQTCFHLYFLFFPACGHVESAESRCSPTGALTLSLVRCREGLVLARWTEPCIPFRPAASAMLPSPPLDWKFLLAASPWHVPGRRSAHLFTLLQAVHLVRLLSREPEVEELSGRTPREGVKRMPCVTMASYSCRLPSMAALSSSSGHLVLE